MGFRAAVVDARGGGGGAADDDVGDISETRRIARGIDPMSLKIEYSHSFKYG